MEMLQDLKVPHQNEVVQRYHSNGTNDAASDCGIDLLLNGGNSLQSSCSKKAYHASYKSSLLQ